MPIKLNLTHEQMVERKKEQGRLRAEKFRNAKKNGTVTSDNIQMVVTEPKIKIRRVVNPKINNEEINNEVHRQEQRYEKQERGMMSIDDNLEQINYLKRKYEEELKYLENIQKSIAPKFVQQIKAPIHAKTFRPKKVIEPIDLVEERPLNIIQPPPPKTLSPRNKAKFNAVINEIAENPSIKDENIRGVEDLDIIMSSKLYIAVKFEYAKKPEQDSADTYDQCIIRLIKVLNVFNRKKLIRMLKQPEKVKELIENYEYATNKKYSINTIRLFFQSVLVFIDLLDLPVDKEFYKKWFEIYKTRAQTELAELKLTKSVPDMDNYIQKVEEVFGTESIQYLVVKMFQEVPFRNNFKLVIVQSINDTHDKTQNFINMNENGTATITLNKFKTDSHYEPVIGTTSIETTNLIRDYMNRKNLSIGDKLFDRNMSQFMSRLNKKIGIEKGGIQNLRRSIVSTLAQNNGTDEEHYILAKKMAHSTRCAVEDYVYPIKNL